ncbi:MAG: methyltransferase [Pseudomonadales bacterium]|jgi:16S rRNA (guanine1207-N2)-methyltransferase|nr:methyltransferase [Pseudomonadales bacterium]
MRDAALTALLDAASAGPGLIVLDENQSTGLPPPPSPHWRALCNRSDVAQAAQAAGWHCECNDFDFSATPPLRQGLYRLSKEKRVAEHVLQALWDKLEIAGELLLSGYKQEGVKTLASRAAAAWGSTAELTRGEGHLHLYRLRKTTETAARLTHSDYHALHLIGEWEGLLLWSKHGIFAWDRIDDGSRLLLEHLPSALAHRHAGQRDAAALSALDLGCGYGLLALALGKQGIGRVLATDNNAAAVHVTAHNLAQYALPGSFQVILDDCASSLNERVDLLVCNPPFHQGFAVEGALTDRFLAAAGRLIKPKGQALFVVNAFIPLERKAAEVFSEVKTLANNRRFKVLHLSQPRGARTR